MTRSKLWISGLALFALAALVITPRLLMSPATMARKG